MCAVRILRQPMPLARSILWAPLSASRPGDMSNPVFLQQSALQAMYEHLASPPPPGQGILGFLLGDRCECPVSGVSYSVIDAALRLNQTIYSDRSRDVVTRLWKRLATQLEEQEAHLIGWYHTHPPLPLALSEHDVETQDLYFGEEWQVGVLVATDSATPAGAFFRFGADEAWVRTPQPFYELLNEDSVRAGGKKRSFLTWKNYRAYNPPALQPRSGASASPAAPSAPRRSAPHAPPEESGETILGLEQTSYAPPPPPPRVSQPAKAVESWPEEPPGMENMPQAELEEPSRTDLDEASEEVAAEEPEEQAEEQDEQEDASALKFLSAAEDSPPPLPTRVAAQSPFLPPPLPPSFQAPDEPTSEAEPEAASDEADAGWAEDPALEGELPLEVLEPSEEVPPEPPAKRRRSGRGIWRKLVRGAVVGAGLLVLVGAGVVAWPYVPSLVQRVKGLMPTRKPGATETRRPAPAPAPAAAPSAPRPAPTRPAIAPRAEFAPLDRAADSLARALQAYDGRTRLFAQRRLDCFVLSRGLVRVERAAMSYGMQRNAVPGTFDAGRGARDIELRAGIDSARSQFMRAGCERQ